MSPLLPIDLTDYETSDPLTGYRLLVDWAREWHKVFPKLRTDDMFVEALDLGQVLRGAGIFVPTNCPMLDIRMFPARINYFDLKRRYDFTDKEVENVLDALYLLACTQTRPRDITWYRTNHTLSVTVDNALIGEIGLNLYETQRGVRQWEVDDETLARTPADKIDPRIKEEVIKLIVPWMNGENIFFTEKSRHFFHHHQYKWTQFFNEREVWKEQSYIHLFTSCIPDADKGGKDLDGALRLNLSILGHSTMPKTIRALENSYFGGDSELEKQAKLIALRFLKKHAENPTYLPASESQAAHLAIERQTKEIQLAMVVLGIYRPLTIDAIKIVRRRRQREAHPDLGGTNEESMAVNQAFDILKDCWE